MVFNSNWIEYVSYISLIIVILCMLKGYIDGFLFKLLDLTATFIALIVSYYIATKLNDAIILIPQDLFSLGVHPQIETFLLTQANLILLMLIAYALIRLCLLILFPLFKSINKVPVIGFLNRLLGSFLGCVHAYIILFLLVLLFHSPFVVNGNEVIENSALKYVKDSATQIAVYADTQYTIITSLQNSDKYKDDPNGNMRVWLEYYDVDPILQDAIIEMIKLRSE